MDFFFVIFGIVFAIVLVICIISGLNDHRERKNSLAGETETPQIEQLPITNDYSDCVRIMPSCTCPKCGSIIEEGKHICSECGCERPSSAIKMQKVFTNDFSFGVITSQYRNANNSIAQEVNRWFMTHGNLEKVSVKFDYAVTHSDVRLLKNVYVTFNEGGRDNNVVYGITTLYYGSLVFKTTTAQNVMDAWQANNPNRIIVNYAGGKTTRSGQNSGTSTDGTLFILYKMNRSSI